MSDLIEIENHPGYFVDREGNCYSSWVNKGRGGIHRTDNLKKLNGSITKNGYVLIRFGRKESKYLHHIILETFISPRPHGMDACHKDDNPSNNKLDNLYWGTRKQNMSDRRRNSHLNEGESHGLRKLDNEKVMYIRKMKGKKPARILADELNVHMNTIYYAQNKDTWKVVK